jgi:O-antigen biosynthesis protein
VKNALICAARSAYYAVTEPHKLKNARLDHLDGVDGVWNHGDPLVSVIIPTHNRADLLLDRCLPSVLGQTYRNLEVIVAAHGCTDATIGIVSRSLRYKGVPVMNDERVRLIEVPREPKYPPTAENHWFAGPVDPINAGLKAARGKWIARIDDDDTWTPDHIENLLWLAQKHNHEFVSAGHSTADTRYVEPYNINGRLIGGVQTWLYRGYLKFMRANPDCWRKRHNRVNDTDLQQRFLDAGVRTGYLPQVVARVLPRPGETVIGLKAYQLNRAETERKLAFR